MTTPTKYTIEHRDKNGNLLGQIQHIAHDVRWEWNRKGGCGRCKIKLATPYREIDFNALDDIRIRIVDGATTKLVYRGWLAGVNRVMKKNQEVLLDIRGYYDFLKYIVVQDTGSEKTYTSQLVSAIVDDIADTFITPNTDITKGTINAASFTCDSINFKVSVDEALRTLADLEGGVEYGVDENLSFFWRDEGTGVSHKFFIGNDIEVLQRKEEFTRIKNKYYFEGAESGGTVLERDGENTDSQSTYFLSEAVVINTAISTNSVADQYISELLDQNDTPNYIMNLKVPDTNIRLEDTIPLGKISIYDDTYDAATAARKIWGTTANGGDNLLWGRADNGGSDYLWGGGTGVFQDQVDFIRYQLSNSEGKFNIEIGMGGSRDETAARIKQIELELNNLRQGR